MCSARATKRISKSRRGKGELDFLRFFGAASLRTNVCTGCIRHRAKIENKLQSELIDTIIYRAFIKFIVFFCDT